MEEPRTEPEVIEVEVEEPEQAESLVRELEERDVEAAKVPDGETVLVSVEEPEGVLGPLVAVEGWLERNEVDEAEVRVDGDTHVVRPRDGTAVDGRRR